MKIAYVFATGLCSTFKLSTMILPQLEQQKHGVQVIGMMSSLAASHSSMRRLREIRRIRSSPCEASGGLKSTD